MILDISLVLIFFASIFTLWYLVSIKIPELVAIPDQVIAERLAEDSAKFQLFILHFKSFFLEKRYKKLLLNFLEKLLYRFHIFILRLDNITVSFLKTVRENGNGNVNGATNGSSEYWNELREKKSFSPKSSMQEVRSKGQLPR